VLLQQPVVDPAALEARTGWAIKPEGACLGDICVPLPDEVRRADGTLDAAALAARLGAPLLHDEGNDLWSLGPATVSGRALSTAQAPDLELPDADGNPFRLSSLRGRKVLLVAWASW
jgi:hypothetical protein